MGKRESDAEMKTQELKLRSERQSAEENRQAETQISFQSLLRSLRQREIWGAKLRRVSAFLGLQTLLSGGCEAMTEIMFVCANVT